MGRARAAVFLGTLGLVGCVQASVQPDAGVGPGAGVTPPVPSGSAVSVVCPPEVPAELAVPEGNRVAFYLDGRGAQLYRCVASGESFGWSLVAPDAELLNPGGQVVGTHYAGPTWEATGGSKVVGAKLAGVTMDPTAVPWLLLSATTHEGAGRMANVTFIQRVATTGGLSPASGCDAGHLDDIARVDYTATYYFYQAQDGTGANPGC